MLNYITCRLIQFRMTMSIRKDKFGAFLKLKHLCLCLVNCQSLHGQLVKDFPTKTVKRSCFSISLYLA